MSAWLDHALQEPGCTRAASIPLREFNQTLELEHLQRPASPADAGPWASAGGSCAGWRQSSRRSGLFARTPRARWRPTAARPVARQRWRSWLRHQTSGTGCATATMGGRSSPERSSDPGTRRGRPRRQCSTAAGHPARGIASETVGTSLGPLHRNAWPCPASAACIHAGLLRPENAMAAPRITGSRTPPLLPERPTRVDASNSSSYGLTPALSTDAFELSLRKARERGS